jgi:hypothetical protein
VLSGDERLDYWWMATPKFADEVLARQMGAESPSGDEGARSPRVSRAIDALCIARGVIAIGL